MSGSKEWVEAQVELKQQYNKGMKWAGWFLIAVGIFLCITIIGLIPGIATIAMGGVLIYLSKSKQANKAHEAYLKAEFEKAEITEHHLEQIRSKQQ